MNGLWWTNEQLGPPASSFCPSFPSTYSSLPLWLKYVLWELIPQTPMPRPCNLHTQEGSACRELVQFTRPWQRKEQPRALPTVACSPSLLPVPVLSFFPFLLRTPFITSGNFPSLILTAGRFFTIWAMRKVCLQRWILTCKGNPTQALKPNGDREFVKSVKVRQTQKGDLKVPVAHFHTQDQLQVGWAAGAGWCVQISASHPTSWPCALNDVRGLIPDHQQSSHPVRRSGALSSAPLSLQLEKLSLKKSQRTEPLFLFKFTLTPVLQSATGTHLSPPIK